MHFISAKLPDDILSQLRKSDGVVIKEECEIKVVELVDSEKGTSVFKAFLKDEREVDPLLYPSFGPPLSPYVVPNIQVEVWNILASFQILRSHDFAPGAVINFIPASFPIPAGIQYRHAQAIQAVQEELQHPTRLAVNCPGIAGLPSGQVICDLSIQYANVAVVTRIRMH